MHMAQIRRSRMVGFFRIQLMLCAGVMGGLWCPIKVHKAIRFTIPDKTNLLCPT